MSDDGYHNRGILTQSLLSFDLRIIDIFLYSDGKFESIPT